MPIKVTLPSGETREVKRLLARTDLKANVKLAKSNRKSTEFLTTGLSLAPHNMSGKQVCPHASKGCISSCLVNSGHAWIFPHINQSRIAKTIAFFSHRAEFLAMLKREIGNARKLAESKGRKLAIRLNVFSDLSWERFAPELFTEFPDVQFYDYTKNVKRMVAFCRGDFPANYHLTFSRSETNENDCIRILRMGGNVAVVFENKLPSRWNRFGVVNGDETDLRFLDQWGTVIGLRAKGYYGIRDESGFVVRA